MTAVVAEEQAPGEEADQAEQDQYRGPHGGTQYRVVVRVGNVIFYRGQAKCFVLRIERALAEVEVADLHAAAA